jgi:hypothetical protein
MTEKQATARFYVDEDDEEYQEGDDLWSQACEAIRWMNGDENEGAPSEKQTARSPIKNSRRLNDRSLAAEASSAHSRINIPFNLDNWKEFSDEVREELMWFHQWILEREHQLQGREAGDRLLADGDLPGAERDLSRQDR